MLRLQWPGQGTWVNVLGFLDQLKARVWDVAFSNRCSGGTIYGLVSFGGVDQETPIYQLAAQLSVGDFGT